MTASLSHLSGIVASQFPVPVVLLHGGHLRVVFANSVAGGSAALGKTLQELFPEISPNFDDCCRRVLATGQPLNGHEALCFVRPLNGILAGRHFSWSLTRVALADSAWGILAIANDVIESPVRDVSPAVLAESRARELDAMKRLVHTGNLLGADGQPDRVLEGILEAAISLTEADFGTIQVLNELTGELEVVVHRGFTSKWLAFWNRVSMTPGIHPSASSFPSRCIVEDITQGEFFTGRGLELQLEAGVRSLQSTPLTTRGGRLVGVVSTHWRAPHRPGETELYFLDVLARQAADFLERRETISALRRSELKASTLIASTADVIIAVDGAQTVVEWNRAAEVVFGYTRAEIMGQPLELLLPDAKEVLQRDVSMLLADRYTATARRKSGEEFLIKGTVSNVSLEGHPLMIVSLRDVTDAWRTETEQQVLADLGAFSLSGIPEAFARTTIALTRGFADFAMMFAVERDERLRKIAASLSDSVPTSTERLLLEWEGPRSHHPIWEVIDRRTSAITERTSALHDSMAIGLERKPELGALILCGGLLVPVVTGSECVGVLALMSFKRKFDERDQKLAEEVARRCALYLENQHLHEVERRAIRMRDEVLAVVAHDLRNPLNAIVLESQLMSRRVTGPERRSTRGFDAILRSAGRLNRIIDDLLDVARLDGGKVALDRNRLNTENLLDEVIEAEHDLIKSRSLELSVEIPAKLPWVFADRSRMLQVFENLIGNAMKFTRSGRITIGARVDGPEVLFWISDTGVGIAAADLPHVFDRFWQVNTARREGAGLGLAIVKGIIMSHGGRLWAESEPGKGSTFFFSLPQSHSPAPSFTRPRSVLIADDDDELRDKLTRWLQSKGYQVASACNGKEALDALRRRQSPDVVIVDLSMPVMDGWSFLEAKRSDPKLQSLPAIVLTGLTGVADDVADFNAELLTKPLSFERLSQVLETVARNRAPSGRA